MNKKGLLLAIFTSAAAAAGCGTSKGAAEPTPEAEETPATSAPAGSSEANAPIASPTPDGEERIDGMTRDEIGEKALVLFGQMNDAVNAGAGDCEKIAADLTEVIAGGKDVMEAGKKFDEDPEAREWFSETYGPRVETILTEMMGGLSMCMDNEAIQEAFKGLE